jgi:hypothetical protein
MYPSPAEAGSGLARGPTRVPSNTVSTPFWGPDFDELGQVDPVRPGILVARTPAYPRG